jgi:hypothetical protein
VGSLCSTGQTAIGGVSFSVRWPPRAYRSAVWTVITGSLGSLTPRPCIRAVECAPAGGESTRFRCRKGSTGRGEALTDIGLSIFCSVGGTEAFPVEFDFSGSLAESGGGRLNSSSGPGGYALEGYAPPHNLSISGSANGGTGVGGVGFYDPPSRLELSGLSDGSFGRLPGAPHPPPSSFAPGNRRLEVSETFLYDHSADYSVASSTHHRPPAGG